MYVSCCCLSHTDHINERRVCNAVCPGKDVDGFHVVNVGRMCLDQSTVLPATPWGVWEIIKRTGENTLFIMPLK